MEERDFRLRGKSGRLARLLEVAATTGATVSTASQHRPCPVLSERILCYCKKYGSEEPCSSDTKMLNLSGVLDMGETETLGLALDWTFDRMKVGSKHYEWRI